MPNIPSNLIFDPLISGREIADIIPTNFHEGRIQKIDLASQSYGGLYDLAIECLKHYGYNDIYEWAMSLDSGRGHAFLKTFFHPSIVPETEALNGLLKPIKLQAAKSNFIIWTLQSTMSSFNIFVRKLKLNNEKTKVKSIACRIEMFRLNALAEGRDWERDDFNRRQILRSFFRPVEGSHRSCAGHHVEDLTREALAQLNLKGWGMTVSDKERIIIIDGVPFRIDLIVESSKDVVLINVKSSESEGSNYSTLYVRHVAGASKVISAEVGGRRVSCITIFVGQNWNRSVISEEICPIFIDDFHELADDDVRCAELMSVLSACEEMKVFRPDEWRAEIEDKDILPAVPSCEAEVLDTSKPSQSSMFDILEI